MGSNVQKGTLYTAVTALSRSASTFSTIEKHVHGQKRRTLAPAFTAPSIAALQPYMLKHIQTFTSRLSSSIKDSGFGGYLNISHWANYLTFDVMGEIAFGKDFNMLNDDSMRTLPGVIDRNVHRQLIVS